MVGFPFGQQGLITLNDLLTLFVTKALHYFLKIRHFCTLSPSFPAAAAKVRSIHD
jgi:hypothetical protein